MPAFNTTNRFATSLNVCLYISTFNPGGAERQIVNLARELSGRGVTVALLHSQRDIRQVYYLDTLRGTDVAIVNVLKPRFLKEGIDLAKRHPQFFRHIPMSLSLRIEILFLAGAFSRFRPDIVHSYLDTPNCMAGCAAVLVDIPVHLASFRNVDPQTGHFMWEEQTYPVYTYLLNHAHPYFEANSRTGARHYARWLNIDVERIAYHPNGIDPSVYMTVSRGAGNAVRQSLGIPPSAPILLTLARFSPEKSPHAMLDVFERVHAAQPEAHYLIAGSRMTEDDEMGEMVRQRGLDGVVHLLGVRSDVAALLSCADIFLLTSRMEGFPNALMEAMTAAVPVVASRVGGVPDLVRHGMDGFLHDPDDVDGMAESVKTLVSDAALRTRLGSEARQRILEQFSLEKLGDRVLLHYQKLLEEAKDANARDKIDSGE